jgi:hypothetical protein
MFLLCANLGAAEPETTAPAAPIRLEIGAHVNRIYELNPSESSFSAEIWIWFRHPEGLELKPLESREFVNALEINSLSNDVETKGGTVWITEKVKGKFTHDFDLTRFPRDTHVLRVEIEEANLDSSQLKFIPDLKNSMIDRTSQRLRGWRVGALSLRVEDHEYGSNFGDPEKVEGAVYQNLIIEIPVERDRTGLVLRIFSGLYLSLAIAMIALFMKTSSDDIFASRTGILAGMIFSVMISKDTAEGVVGPTTGSNAVDKLHGIGLLLIFCLLLVTLVSRRLSEANREAAAVRLDRTALFVMASLFLGANFLLLYA